MMLRESGTHIDIAVQIAEPEPELQRECDTPPLCMKQFPAGMKRRLSGKLPPSQLPHSSSRSSLSESSASIRPPAEEAPAQASSSHAQPSHQSHRRQYYSEKLLAQVGDWLEHERKKAENRRKKPGRRKSKSPPKGQKDKADAAETQNREQEAQAQAQAGRPRSESIDSQSSEISFDRLQRILEDSMAHMGLTSVPHFSPRLSRRHRKVPSRTSLHRAASSDTDYVDGDAIVPTCDAWLDNSKTMSYSGGNASTDDVTSTSDNKPDKEKEAWSVFKNEIVRIAHTLRLKGWRRVPLGEGDGISVERLSGALTNAVYVVSPPKDLPESESKRQPPKLLLRVYGAQAENLIDRDNELEVLKRLARKRIGPRLLGTFQNGRFEQYFNAITLTAADIREPDVMKQIAKRMRELHEGIDLLPHEREGGSATLKSWDSWVDNAERIATFLDKQYESSSEEFSKDSIVHAWKAGGYVCGTPWPKFKETVYRYREHLERAYNGQQEMNDSLVFAHSDVRNPGIVGKHSLTWFTGTIWQHSPNSPRR